jgi:LemA protein
VKGYAAHEKTTLANVTAARSRASVAASPAERSREEGAIGQVLGSLFAVAENYPDLKASAGFLALQQQVRDLEDQIEQARRAYNAQVRDFNTLIESFPSNFVATSFGFTKAEFFEPPPPAEGGAPRISFKA